MGWIHQTCDQCGGDITFFTDAAGRHIPVHTNRQACSGSFGRWLNYGSSSSMRRTSEGLEFEFPFVTHPTYIKPNARCPACNKLVYFFQSANGAWVLLDELGPPWPKHGCMEESAVRVGFATADGRKKQLLQTTNESPEAAWVKNGWIPFVVTKVVERRSGIEALGELHKRDAVTAELRIWQDSTEMNVWKHQKDLTFGFNLVMNAGMVVEALYESPVLLRKETEAVMSLGTFVMKGGITPLTTQVMTEMVL